MADFVDEFLAQGKAKPQAAGGDFVDEFLSGGGGGLSETTINEMHPKFDFADRLIVKNFGGDLDQSIGYLKKRHPSLDIKASPDGGIIARAKGETDYRRLDPEGLLNSISNPKELFQDVTDVGTDILQGVGTTAATAAGGLVGNIPGAMAGGAAAGAGLESLRQGIGKALGVRETADLGDVALQGAFGAASPLLLGSGASAGQAAKVASRDGVLSQLRQGLQRYFGREGVVETGESILKDQRGMAGVGYDYFRDKIAPQIGELTSGVAADTIRTARDKLPEIKKMEKTGITGLAEATKKEAEQAVKTAKQFTGGAIEEAVDQSSTPVSLAAASKPFDDLALKIEDALTRRPDNPALKAQLDKVLATRDQFFTPGEVTATPRDAWELMQDLKVITKPGRMPSTTLASGFSPTATVADKRVVMAATKAAKNLSEGIATATAGHPTGGTAVLNKDYQRIAKDAKAIKRFFADDDKIAQRLGTIEGPANRQSFERMARFDKDNNTNIVDKAKLMSAFQNFGKAPWLARSTQGTTSTSRTVPLGLAGAAVGGFLGAQQGGSAGAWLGAGAGGLAGATLGGPKALRAYMQTQRNLSKMAEQGKQLGVSPQAASLSVWEMLRRENE